MTAPAAKRAAHTRSDQLLLLAAACSGGCPEASGRVDKEGQRRLKRQAENPFADAVAAATRQHAAVKKRQTQPEWQQTPPALHFSTQLPNQQEQGQPSEQQQQQQQAEEPALPPHPAPGLLQDSGAADAEEAVLYAGRTSSQLLQDVDTVTAYVANTLLPQLQASAAFQEVKVGKVVGRS